MIPLIPDPWRLASRVLAVGLLLFAVYLFGRHDGAAHVQAQWQADKAAQAGRQAQAEKLMRERENLMNERVRKAESNAEMRQNENRRLAADAAATANRLRNDLAAARGRLSAATAEACRATASTALELLGTCADDYRDMAAAADGHAADVQTLTEAWPQ